MWTSQRSLHDAPIFRLLLKVAVNGMHQCDFLIFCGASGSNRTELETLANACPSLNCRFLWGVCSSSHSLFCFLPPVASLSCLLLLPPPTQLPFNLLQAKSPPLLQFHPTKSSPPMQVHLLHRSFPTAHRALCFLPSTSNAIKLSALLLQKRLDLWKLTFVVYPCGRGNSAISDA